MYTLSFPRSRRRTSVRNSDVSDAALAGDGGGLAVSGVGCEDGGRLRSRPCRGGRGRRGSGPDAPFARSPAFVAVGGFESSRRPGTDGIAHRGPDLRFVIDDEYRRARQGADARGRAWGGGSQRLDRFAAWRLPLRTKATVMGLTRNRRTFHGIG